MAQGLPSSSGAQQSGDLVKMGSPKPSFPGRATYKVDDPVALVQRKREHRLRRKELRGRDPLHLLATIGLYGLLALLMTVIILIIIAGVIALVTWVFAGGAG